EFLTQREQGLLVATANSTMNTALISLEAQATDIFATDDPDRAEKLRALEVQANRYQTSPRFRQTQVHIQTRIQMAGAEDLDSEDRVTLAFDILEGRSDEPFPQDQKTLKGMINRIDASGQSANGTITDMLAIGSRQLPENWLEQNMKLASAEQRNLPAYTERMSVIGRHSLDQMQRISDTHSVVGQAALGATRGIDDPIERDRRLALLSTPSAEPLINQADTQLEDGDGNFRPELLTAPLSPPAGFVKGFGGIPFPRFFRPSVRTGPVEMTELQNRYRFHYVAIRENTGTSDPGDLRRAATVAAANEFAATHTQIEIAKSGRNWSYYLPTDALRFRNNMSMDHAAAQIAPKASELMRDAGNGSGLLAGKPIINHNSEMSWFAVSNVTGQVTGFVEWDSGRGIARNVLQGNEPDLFATLSTALFNTGSDLRPTPELQRPGNVTQMADSTANDMVDLALEDFRSQNNGREPRTDEEWEAVMTRANAISSRHDWNP
ncbi:MAG: hypothetical protein ACYSVY_27040, partial [Planctomycetota bacterium]